MRYFLRLGFYGEVEFVWFLGLDLVLVGVIVFELRGFIKGF